MLFGDFSFCKLRRPNFKTSGRLCSRRSTRARPHLLSAALSPRTRDAWITKEQLLGLTGYLGFRVPVPLRTRLLLQSQWITKPRPETQRHAGPKPLEPCHGGMGSDVMLSHITCANSMLRKPSVVIMAVITRYHALVCSCALREPLWDAELT